MANDLVALIALTMGCAVALLFAWLLIKGE